jgi:hypothetical protein
MNSSNKQDDNDGVYIAVQSAVMATKNELRFMKDPVYPEKIVESVQKCFEKLGGSLPKIRGQALRISFKAVVKKLAQVTDQAIASAANGQWECDIQVIFDVLDEMINLFVEEEVPVRHIGINLPAAFQSNSPPVTYGPDSEKPMARFEDRYPDHPQRDIPPPPKSQFYAPPSRYQPQYQPDEVYAPYQSQQPSLVPTNRKVHFEDEVQTHTHSVQSAAFPNGEPTSLAAEYGYIQRH